MKRKKWLQTVVSFLLITTLMMQTVFTSYASSIISTNSNAASMEFDSTEYSISTYSAGGAFASAVHWLWALILSLCGISVSNTSDIDSIASEISTWAQGVGKPNIYAQLLTSIGKAAWGTTVDNLKDMVAMVKAWLKEKDGYGTDAGIENIVVFNKVNILDSYSALYNYDYATDIMIPSTAIYFNSHRYWQGGTGYWAEADFFYNSSIHKVAAYVDGLLIRPYYYNTETCKVASSRDIIYIIFRDKAYYETYADWFLRCEEENLESFIQSCPFPVYENKAQVDSYLACK